MRIALLSLLFAFLLVQPGYLSASKPVTPETALQSYLHNGDKSFQWELKNTIQGNGVTFYQIVYTSQTWQKIRWTHELMIMVPADLAHDKALLFITGGSNKNGVPNTHKVSEDLPDGLSRIAKVNKAVVALLWQVPNQPLYDDLTEDALISYTLHNYQGDHDFNWPLLFPMTKSAVRAMDIVQEFGKRNIHKKISGFVVSGASKRGWTTWLTGASDKRVVAIGPMVIDMLNMPVNIPYHKVVWGDYSIEIQDYVKLGLAQQFGDEKSSDLVKMIDPYSYRKTLTMPKMLFMGTNDQYWPVDAVKNYIDDIPGNNHICYTPNAGHDLGDKKKALTTLSAFLGNTLNGGSYPVFDYSFAVAGGKVTLTAKTTPDRLVGASLFSTSSPNQEFRDKKWSSAGIEAAGLPVVKAEVELPSTGFKAFYLELKYKSPFGDDYTECTRMFVADGTHVLPRQ